MCSHVLMRAALRILVCVQCVLLAGTTLAADVALGAPPTTPTAPPASAIVPSSGGASTAASTAVAEAPPTAAEAGLPSPPGTPASAAQPLAPEDLLFASPTTLDHLGRVVAAVRINGKGPFKFVVDTGANHSAISPQLAELLGLKLSLAQSIRVTGITGSAQMGSVPVEMLKAGDLEIADTRFPVIWSPMMAGTAGILGAAGLTKDRLVVDFDRNQVLITRSHRESFPLGFTRIWATRLDGGLLSVPGHVGNVPVQAVIDTGSQRTLGNLALYRELFAHEQGKDRYVDATVYGATKQAGAGKLQMAPVIDLDAIRISGVALVFGDFHIFEAWNLTSEPTIVLGMDVLGTVKALAIDFRYGEIGIEGRYAYEPTVRSGSDCRSIAGAPGLGCSD